MREVAQTAHAALGSQRSFRGCSPLRRRRCRNRARSSSHGRGDNLSSLSEPSSFAGRSRLFTALIRVPSTATSSRPNSSSSRHSLTNETRGERRPMIRRKSARLEVRRKRRNSQITSRLRLLAASSRRPISIEDNRMTVELSILPDRSMVEPVAFGVARSKPAAASRRTIWPNCVDETVSRMRSPVRPFSSFGTACGSKTCNLLEAIPRSRMRGWNR